MGFFSKYNSVEKELLNIYSKNLQLPEEQVRELLDKCIEEAKQQNSYNAQQNLGDFILERERLSGQKNENLEAKRKEGVKDEDIKWWWNLNDIERRMMIKVDDFHRMSLFIGLREQNKSVEDADRGVRKRHPIYGDLKDERFTKGDDRPLPLELKDRINIYIENKWKESPEQFKKEMDDSSTFNALIRKEIRAGKI